MARAADLEHVHLTSRRAWRAWLAEHHDTSPGIWLVTFKRASGKPRLEYADIVEEALCFGWIDSRAGTLDEERAMLMMTPRRPKGVWSRPNRERVARLEAAGLMTPRGREAVAVAKRNGAWDALDDVDALRIPDDLAARLDATPRARQHFDAFPPSAKKQILHWIGSARRPETRARRVAETARLAARNQRAAQPAATLARGKVR